jgi:phosphoribosylamine--glycine ligase
VRVLVVGSGGREHALAWKLSQSALCNELHAAPGNPGIAEIGECHPLRADDADALLALARALSIDLVVIGPEAPLVAGVADVLRRGGVLAFGPGRAAAQIEGSKSFAKDVMHAAGVPTAETMPVARPPCVVKADGLAAGKGVFVCRTQEELDAGLRAAAAFEGPLVIEELLEGEELSLFALSDGVNAKALPSAQDFKRAFDGDVGPNTGGMGAYSPISGFDSEQLEDLVDTIHRPVLRELTARGTPYVGVLFAGVMLTPDGPRVLEFNCRFGDPEAQAILPRLDGDLVAALAAAAAGDVGSAELTTSARAAVTVVIAAGDYPAATDSGTRIVGVEEAAAAGALVFHAGTALRQEQLVTNGGRILNVTAVGDDLAQAREHAYDACSRISFEGMRYRRDIALAAAEPERVRG